jgi:hypothetical protein
MLGREPRLSLPNADMALGVSTWASANALPLKKIVVHGWTF